MGDRQGDWRPGDQDGTCDMVSRRGDHMNNEGRCHGSVSTAVMYQVGKKAAGARLDGREWREVPHA